MPSFILFSNQIKPGQYLGTWISEDNMKFGRIVKNPQEVGKANPAVRKGRQVEKPNGFSNERELLVD